MILVKKKYPVNVSGNLNQAYKEAALQHNSCASMRGSVIKYNLILCVAMEHLIQASKPLVNIIISSGRCLET